MEVQKVINNIVLFQNISIIINLIAIVSLLIIGLSKTNLKLVLSLCIVLIVSIFYGLRSVDIGMDSLEYANIFISGSERQDFEPMFLLISNFIKIFTTEANAFFIVINFLTNLFVFLGFKNVDEKKYPIIFAVYISTFLFMNMNVSMIRQGLAMGLSFYAVSCLIKNNSYKKYFLYSVLALMTHLSSIFVLFFIFLKNIKFSLKNISIYTAILIMLFYINLSDITFLLREHHWIFDKIHFYLTWNKGEWHIKHFYYLVFALIILYTYLFYKYGIKNEINLYSYNIILFGFLLIGLFRADEMLVDRIFYYFLFFIMILIVNLKHYIRFTNIYLLGSYYVVFLGLLFVWLSKSEYQFYTWFITQEAIK